MADFSSCYFCGAAMDVSLREYPVVPEAFEPTPDDQETVLLCGTCQRKLTRVLEPVVDAARSQAARHQARSDQGQTVDSSSPITDAEAHARATHESGSSTTDQADAQDAATARDSPNAGDSGNAQDTTNTQIISPTIANQGDDASQSDPEHATDADANGDADDAGMPFEVDETTSVFDDDEDEDVQADQTDSIFADGTTTIPSTDAADDRAGTDATASRSDSTDATGSTLGDGINFSDQQGTENTAGNRTQTANQNAGPSANADRSATTDRSSNAANAAGSSSTDATDDHDVDAKTYNKVVRLLKNRDLPIPRDEIEAIAGSAYDIPAHECEAIIDAAVTRGLVDERNGNLVHPDGV